MSPIYPNVWHPRRLTSTTAYSGRKNDPVQGACQQRQTPALRVVSARDSVFRVFYHVLSFCHFFWFRDTTSPPPPTGANFCGGQSEESLLAKLQTASSNLTKLGFECPAKRWIPTKIIFPGFPRRGGSGWSRGTGPLSDCPVHVRADPLSASTSSPRAAPSARTRGDPAKRSPWERPRV